MLPSGVSALPEQLGGTRLEGSSETFSVHPRTDQLSGEGPRPNGGCLTLTSHLLPSCPAPLFWASPLASGLLSLAFPLDKSCPSHRLPLLPWLQLGACPVLRALPPPGSHLRWATCVPPWARWSMKGSSAHVCSLACY